MQNLNKLWQIVKAAQAISDITRHKKTYHFPAGPNTTFYMRAENAAVRVVRWQRPQVELTVELSPAVAWRIGTDYDADGVYIALARRPFVGSVARAGVSVAVPEDTHLCLRLDDGMVQLDHVYGVLDVAPPTHKPNPAILPRPSHAGTSRVLLADNPGSDDEEGGRGEQELVVFEGDPDV